MNTNQLQCFEKIDGIITQGHQVASGKAKDSPFPLGTIEMQRPFFLQYGIPIEYFHTATLNVDISPFKFNLINPDFTVDSLKWSPQHKPESFSFLNLFLVFNSTTHPAMLYYPHPETKISHHQSNSTLEILASHIKGITYGSKVTLHVNPKNLHLTKKTD